MIVCLCINHISQNGYNTGLFYLSKMKPCFKKNLGCIKKKLWLMASKQIQKKFSGCIPTQRVCLVQFTLRPDLRATHPWVSEALGVAPSALCSLSRELNQDEEPDVCTRPRQGRSECIRVGPGRLFDSQTQRKLREFHWDSKICMLLPQTNLFCVELQVISSSRCVPGAWTSRSGQPAPGRGALPRRCHRGFRRQLHLWTPCTLTM